MEFTQPDNGGEEEDCRFDVVEDEDECPPPCCPICSLVWTIRDCALRKEIHVNACLEKFNLESCKLPPHQERKQAKASCPICDEPFDNAFGMEEHVNKCLDKSADATNDPLTKALPSVQELGDIQPSIAKTLSRCPICLQPLPENVARRVRHIKSCASIANVTGPRDLDSNEYEGALDLLIAEADRKIDNEEGIVKPKNDRERREDELQRKSPTKITQYFSTAVTQEKLKSNENKHSANTSAAAQSTLSHQSIKPWKTCPSWKRIPDTSLVVDAFEYAHPDLSQIYLLSHFHYDHYIGLTRQFNSGIIYCSATTSRLVSSVLKVNKSRLRTIRLGERTDLGEGTFVTAFDANHAPGSCVFVIETKSNKLYVHTGDFRANELLSVRIRHFAAQLLRPIDAIFLDTTYCDPHYDFLPQEQVIQKCREMIEEHLRMHPRTLVLFGSYAIGKEKLAMGCLPKDKKQLAVTKQKMKIIRCYDFSISELAQFTTERSLSSFWVVGMNELERKNLTQLRRKHLNRFDSLLAIRATGWVKSFQKHIGDDGITTLFVPYSEHSSFGELKMFLRVTNPIKVVPTVVGKGCDKNEMLKLLMY